jgi:hypothetical protein
MRLGIGLLGRSLAWEELLLQEGVSWGYDGPDTSWAEPWSILLVSRRPSPLEWEFVRERLRAGSALVSTAEFLAESDPGISGGNRVRLAYLVPGDHSPLEGVGLVDIESECEVPREANAMLTNDGGFAVSTGEFRGVPAVFLPFDPAAAYEDFRASERYFHAGTERLPTERVSRIGKGEVLHLLHAVFEYLHRVRNLPYVTLSNTPEGSSSVFCFRVDTDAGTREQIDQLEAIAREFSMGFSWFVDAGSHAGWISRFASMPGHEIGLHCLRHRIFLDAEKDRDNIRQGRAVLENARMQVRSLAAPFGFWSHDLATLMEEEGFSHSSEFSWAYDALPGHPVDGAHRFPTLQVPIHPVSIGSLRKAGFDENQMIEYFRGVVARKRVRGEPLMFYAHPTHEMWNVTRDLCSSALEENVRPMTMGAFAAWWEDRCRVRYEVRNTTGGLEIDVREGKDVQEIGLRVSFLSDQAVTPLAARIPLTGLSWRLRQEFRLPDDIRRTREFDLRGEIGRSFTRIQRRFL